MTRILALALGCALGMATVAARADIRMRNIDPVWKAECGSCHTGFPPELLRAQDWKKVMEGLDKHFGANATVSADEARAIAAWLEKNAAGDGDARRAAPDGRLTTTPWFVREHRGIKPEQWAHPDIKRPSNCGACHLEADEGVFGHRVSIPGTAPK